MGKDEVDELASKAIDGLRLSPPVTEALRGIQLEVAEAYREGFLEMVQAIKRQASALDRLQTTLTLLVEHLAPSLKERIPVALRVAADGELPDVASALFTADPIGMGYTLTGRTLAQSLGVSEADLSILSKAFRLSHDALCAVVVRGGTRSIVNYHPRAIERFRELIASPPAGLTPEQKRAHRRVVQKLILAGGTPGGSSSPGP